MILPDKIYNIMKWFLTIVCPALIALITGLGALYHFDTETITGTIALFATFFGVILGISNANYKKGDNNGN